MLACRLPDFTALQRRMLTGIPSAGLLASVPVTLIVFDVLEAGGRSLLREPYVLRRAPGASRARRGLAPISCGP